MGFVFRAPGKKLLLSVFVLILLWIGGFIVFVLSLPLPIPEPHKLGVADGVVVLTGGDRRIQQGLKLFKAGAGGRLFISGVHGDVRLGDWIFADLTPQQKQHVDLGFRARSTRGNAAETAEWTLHHHMRSLYLVTSHYHMPRSLLEFQRALQKGTVVLPYPVLSSDFKGSYGDMASSKFFLLWREYHKFLIVWLHTRLSWGRSIQGG